MSFQGKTPNIALRYFNYTTCPKKFYTSFALIRNVSVRQEKNEKNSRVS